MIANRKRPKKDSTITNNNKRHNFSPVLEQIIINNKIDLTANDDADDGDDDGETITRSTEPQPPPPTPPTPQLLTKQDKNNSWNTDYSTTEKFVEQSLTEIIEQLKDLNNKPPEQEEEEETQNVPVDSSGEQKKLHNLIKTYLDVGGDGGGDDDNLNETGIWWNFLKSDKNEALLRLRPENVLVNYIWQSKAYCSYYHNDDFFNYISIGDILTHLGTAKIAAAAAAAVDYSEGEIGLDTLLNKFSDTTDKELILRGLLLTTQTTCINKDSNDIAIEDMKKYEIFDTNRIALGGNLEDWRLLLSMLEKLKKRCVLVIDNIMPDQAKKLIHVNDQLSKIVEKIIEHKLSIIDGRYWDNLMWYHHGTLKFSGLICQFSLIKTPFDSDETISINKILPETGVFEPEPDNEMPSLNIYTGFDIKKTNDINFLDSILRISARQ